MISMDIRGTQAVTRNLQRGSDTVRVEAEKQMTRAQVYLADYIARRKLSGQVMKRRSGALAASIRPGRRTWQGNRLTGVVGTSMIYGRIHEEGGTIRAKKGQFLTIPVGAALTPAGVTQKPYRQWTDLSLRPFRTGKGWVALHQGKPVWILKPSVRIPKRPYFEPARRETAPRIQEMLGRMVGPIIDRAEGR